MQNNKNIRIINSSNAVIQKLLDNSYLKSLNLRMIADSHSISSSREIINSNFKALGWVVEVVQNFPLEFLLSFKVPDNPKENVQYVIIWNEKEQRYELSGENANIYAGKWRIREDETLIVKEDYQHIVYGRFLNEGTVQLDGELVIL